MEPTFGTCTEGFKGKGERKGNHRSLMRNPARGTGREEHSPVERGIRFAATLEVVRTFKKIIKQEKSIDYFNPGSLVLINFSLKTKVQMRTDGMRGKINNTVVGGKKKTQYPPEALGVVKKTWSTHEVKSDKNPGTRS